MNEVSKVQGEPIATPSDIAPRPAPVVSETVIVDAPKKSRKRLLLMVSIPLLILAVGAYFWLAGGKSVGTDNAYVKQDIVAISTQINGPVSAVLVRENQRVKAGDILYHVDPAPAEVALLQAEAQLAAAQLQTRQLEVQASGTGGDISGAVANLAIMQRALGRQQALLGRGFTTRSDYDDAVNEVTKAQTQLADARARSNNAAAAIAPDGKQPAIAAARAAVARARLDLQRGIVRTPSSGVVAKADRLLVGQSAIPGVAMLSIVTDKPAWIEANFKEGDLARMHVGQPAEVRFDAYPGVTLKGHVASIGAGTGSEFSVLPAQNANGNWVKVTQRVPVLIALDEKPRREMIAGLSAKVDVRIDGK
ncbi:MAG: HlyD family secretion protein [Sphingomonas bacterium]|nr:HlyD family secretion protein [Sphingomonas bacterium]